MDNEMDNCVFLWGLYQGMQGPKSLPTLAKGVFQVSNTIIVQGTKGHNIDRCSTIAVNPSSVGHKPLALKPLNPLCKRSRLD